MMEQEVFYLKKYQKTGIVSLLNITKKSIIKLIGMFSLLSYCKTRFFLSRFLFFPDPSFFWAVDS